MNCPACQTENATEAIACSRCGRSLRSDSAVASPTPPARRSGSRRRNANGDDAVANDSDNPAAWRAYRVAMWSFVPGLGLFLGPVAIVLGRIAVRGAGEDASARNRARAAVLFGVLVTLTQWLGIALMVYGWRSF